MDKKSREIIQKYKHILSKTISYESIKEGLKKYKIFTKAMFDDIFSLNSERDFYVELCTRGPDAFTNFLMVLRSAGYGGIADDLQNKKDNEKAPNYYKMDSKPFIGYCLIIVNQEFDIEKKYRKGCRVDVDALQKLFKELKYDVQIEWNKGRDEMKSILKKFSQKSEFSEVDSCIVYILSHGGQFENLDYIEGTDLGKVYKNYICSMFNNENCKLLLGKPKIFFFQACRGHLMDEGVTKNPGVCDANDNAISENSPDFVNVSSPEFDIDGIEEMKFPLYSDMFIVHSTLSGHKSWKNDFTGSWLCQDLVSVVSEYYDKYDLATMMTFVNRKQIMRESDEGYKQIADFQQIGVTGLLKFK